MWQLSTLQVRQLPPSPVKLLLQISQVVAEVHTRQPSMVQLASHVPAVALRV